MEAVVQMREMAALRTRLIIWTILATAGVATAEVLPPPYKGQEPPGLVPTVFAPGLISVPGRFVHSVCLSQDCRECYFTVRTPDWSSSQIMVTRFEAGNWTQPVPLSFGRMCPSLADGDQSLYFIGQGAKVWKARRVAHGWSEPVVLPSPVNSREPAWSCNLSSLGNLWICSWRAGGLGRCDVWQIRSKEGQFTEAVNLRDLNTPGFDCYPVAGPNEAYVIYASDRPGGQGRTDLYISFSDGQGGWSPPRNLGPGINSADGEVSPSLSADYKVLFFSRETAAEASIYWVRVEAFLTEADQTRTPSRPVQDATKGAGQ
jgi:hypothetical protein